tara:strand:- start:554 stop:1051 length:498 start_codon:yes stop_codon:yes gene_type:complete
MSDYAAFYLNSDSSVVQLELLRISHPNFSQVYHLVRNNSQGMTVAIDGQDQFFEYYPLQIKGIGNRDNLDFGLSIVLGDLGELLPQELDNVSTANGFEIKPEVTFWTYRSDDLTQPLFGPIYLEVTSISFNHDGANFEAKAPSLNVNRTGELYKLDRFPGLRSFL